MKHYAEKNLQQIFQHPQNQAALLVKKTQQLNQLNQFLQNALEQPLALHCRVANFRDPILIVEIDSAAWATQFHYQIPDLLFSLQKTSQLRTLKKIECYIKPQVVSKPPPAVQHNISAANAELLRETAQHISAPGLKLALERLGRKKS